MRDVIANEIIEERIFYLRGQKVMIDRDLAQLYGVETKYLNRQVKRNKERFPLEFMFQLNLKEKEELVTICHRFKMMKHSSTLPYVFTEHGVVMLSSVLRSKRAVQVNIAVVRAFIKMREMLNAHKELIVRLNALERKTGRHDVAIREIFKAIHQLMTQPEKSRSKIGFRP